MYGYQNEIIIALANFLFLFLVPTRCFLYSQMSLVYSKAHRK